MIQKVAVELRAKAQYALFLLAFFAFALEMHADDKQCPKCHGSGWQVTIPAVGHYGVEKKKQKCPVCGKMVFSGHRDKCTRCGGSGRIGNGRKSNKGDYADRRGAEGEAFFAQYLTAEENRMRASLMQAVMATRYVVEPCTACKGAKTCQHCGGVRNWSLDADASTLCPACGGGGLCVACNGKGSTNGHQEFVYSQAERDKMSRNCGVYSRLANIRYSYGISPNDPNGPRIGIDKNGYYYIQNDPSRKRR